MIIDCYTALPDEYFYGTINVSKAGYECQAWSWTEVTYFRKMNNFEHEHVGLLHVKIYIEVCTR